MVSRFTQSTALLAGLAFAVSACSAPSEVGSDAAHRATSSTAGAPTATSRGEEGDIAYAERMISHSAVSVEITAMALEDRYRASTQVQNLAQTMGSHDEQLIDTMDGWLASWGVLSAEDEPEDPQVAADSAQPGPAASGAQSPAAQTVTPAQTQPTPTAIASGATASETSIGLGRMEELASLSGADFDTYWLQMMIDHRARSLQSAQKVLETTSNAQVREQARQTQDTASNEIVAMRELLWQQSTPPATGTGGG